MAKKKIRIPIDNNADTNFVNETSQKFDHPKASIQKNLKKDSNYVSLKKIKQVDKDKGVSPKKVQENSNRIANTRGVSSGYGLSYSSSKKIKKVTKTKGSAPVKQENEEE